ncbi:MAG: cytochrome c [Gammaproteobacteria bacterium]|nr:MAG: cytochrome c [Gammaproteobacteria bacterium]
MKYVNWISSLLIMPCLFSPVMANIEKGKLLYEKDCQGCHGTEVFTQPDRKVKNLAQLSKRVRQCTYATEKKWFNEDVDAVVNYLNNYFYKF